MIKVRTKVYRKVVSVHRIINHVYNSFYFVIYYINNHRIKYKKGSLPHHHKNKQGGRRWDTVGLKFSTQEVGVHKWVYQGSSNYPEYKLQVVDFYTEDTIVS